MTRASIENLLDATRLAGLITTEGGRILVKTSCLDAKGTAYRGALVELEGDGEDRQILPLTRGSSSIGAVVKRFVTRCRKPNWLRRPAKRTSSSTFRRTQETDARRQYCDRSMTANAARRR